MRIYLAGPMTNIPKFNFPAFDAAAKLLRSHGHDVVSPAEIDAPEVRAACLQADGTEEEVVGQTWGTALGRDLDIIKSGTIDAIVVLPGWQQSDGASLETHLAHRKKLPVYRIEELTA